MIAVLYAYLDVEYDTGISGAINQVFGIYCSGCGLTRAGIAILQLDFYQAFRYNAFSLIFIPGIFFASVCFIWESIFNKRSIISKFSTSFWAILFVPYLQPITL